jgi:hypothetical protein
MANKKSKKEIDIPKIKEEVVEEKPVEVETKYILKKDITKSLKKGMKISTSKFEELIRTGTNIDGWFE